MKLSDQLLPLELGVSLVLLGGASAGQDLVYAFHGANPNAELGRYLLGPGDLDGDGFEDLVTVLNWGTQELRAHSGVTGQTLWFRSVGDIPGGGFVTNAAAVTGDLDGDGVRDLVLGSAGTWSPGVNAGRVRVFSGVDGAELWTQVGEASNLFFGTSVAGIDDVDGDGLEDVAVGAWSDEPDPPIQGNVGSVRVLSGADGTELYRIYGPALASSGPNGPGMGGTLGRLGDFDGDGVDDIGVGPYKGTSESDRGDVASPVWIVSGRNGDLITVLAVPPYASSFQSVFGNPGDLTGDGIAEVVVGYHHSTNPGSNSHGLVRLYEGGSWVILADWHAEAPGELVGGSLAMPGDVDGDGYGDVLVGVHYPGATLDPHFGVVRLFSGKTHEELFEILAAPAAPPAELDYFGRSLAALGDLNGDGAPEFAVGMLWGDGVDGPGRVEVRSTRPLTLFTQVPYVSAAGGLQRLRIELGPAHAGELYVVLGSASGVAPAVPVDGLPLPLLPDAYTTWILSSAGGPIGPGFVGPLNDQGQGLVNVSIPPLVGPLAGLIGETLWHAALAIGPTGTVTATTNAAPLALLP